MYALNFRRGMFALGFTVRVRALGANVVNTNPTLLCVNVLRGGRTSLRHYRTAFFEYSMLCLRQGMVAHIVAGTHRVHAGCGC